MIHKLIGVVLLILVAVFSPERARAATFVIDSVLDTSDATPGDGVCDDGSANCTLRAAIEEANALAGADTITPGPGDPYEITISSELTITSEVLIDGESVDCSGTHENHKIQVTTSGNFSAFNFQSGSANSTIQGIQIHSASTSGAIIDISDSDITVHCNHLHPINVSGFLSGIATGATVEDGLSITNNSIEDGNNNLSDCLNFPNDTNLVVDGNYLLSCEDGVFLNNTSFTITDNVIVNQSHYGIDIIGGSSGTITGNKIGVDSDGLTGIGNKFSGIYIEDSDDIVIGGPLAADRNIISDNFRYGIEIEGTSDATEIENNYIGYNVNGEESLCNGRGSIDDNGTNTTLTNNLSCAGNTIGCCSFSGTNDISATCLDSTFAPPGYPVNQVQCEEMASTINEATTSYTYGDCQGGELDGVCTAFAPPDANIIFQDETSTQPRTCAYSAKKYSILMLENDSGTSTVQTSCISREGGPSAYTKNISLAIQKKKVYYKSCLYVCAAITSCSGCDVTVRLRNP